MCSHLADSKKLLFQSHNSSLPSSQCSSHPQNPSILVYNVCQSLDTVCDFCTSVRCYNSRRSNSSLGYTGFSHFVTVIFARQQYLRLCFLRKWQVWMGLRAVYEEHVFHSFVLLCRYPALHLQSHPSQYLHW